MKAENIQDIYELSSIQQGILFHCINDPKSGFYFVQKLFTLNGNLNFAAFDRAWKRVIDRHPSLRTGFYWEDINKPLQVVYQQVKVPIEQQDWRGLDTLEQQQQLNLLMKEDLNRGFDLAQKSQIRLTLVRFSDHAYKFVWSSHFIILDGWSVMFVLDDLIQFYEAFCQDKEISLAAISPFKNHITWLQKQDLVKADMFWRQALKGLKIPTVLTKLHVKQAQRTVLNQDFNLTKKKRIAEEEFGLSEIQEKQQDHQRIWISEQKTAALTSFTRRYHLTLNTLIQGAWALLLSRYSGQNKVLYGYTTAGRSVNLTGSDSMVGTLVNSLPVWVEVDDQKPLLVWLQQLQKQLVEMRKYEYSSLVDIQGCTDIPRDIPFFESLVVFEKVPLLSSFKVSEGKLELEMTSLWYKTNYPLNLVVYPFEKIILEIAFHCHLFDEVTISGILHNLDTLLQNILGNPEICLKDISLLTSTEQKLRDTLKQEATFDLALKN